MLPSLRQRRSKAVRVSGRHIRPAARSANSMQSAAGETSTSCLVQHAQLRLGTKGFAGRVAAGATISMADEPLAVTAPLKQLRRTTRSASIPSLNIPLILYRNGARSLLRKPTLVRVCQVLSCRLSRSTCHDNGKSAAMQQHAAVLHGATRIG